MVITGSVLVILGSLAIVVGIAIILNASTVSRDEEYYALLRKYEAVKQRLHVSEYEARDYPLDDEVL